MINSIGLARLNNSDLLNFFKELDQICQVFNPQLLGFGSKLDVLKTKWTELSGIFLQETASPLSPLLEKLDQRRDRAISGIKMYVESLALHYNEKVVEASKIVLEAILKYGENIANQNFIVETNTLNSLLKDFEMEGNIKDAVKTLNLVEWVQELKAANLEFNDVYLKRNIETGQKPEGTFTEKKGAVIDIYESLVISIKSLYVVNGGTVLSNLIQEINSLIARNNKLLTKD